MEKFCPDCGCDRPIDLFSFKNKSKGTRQAYCNDHRQIRERLRYQRIKTTTIAKVRERTASNKAVIVDWKDQFVCQLCGENETCCIDFHHLDPLIKEISISAMTQRGYTLKRVKEEASKCVPLCSNCHRKVHAGVLVL